jgi:hypothetical protein
METTTKVSREVSAGFLFTKHKQRGTGEGISLISDKQMFTSNTYAITTRSNKL